MAPRRDGRLVTMAGHLDSGIVLAVLVALGAFVATYVVRRVVRRVRATFRSARLALARLPLPRRRAAATASGASAAPPPSPGPAAAAPAAPALVPPAPPPPPAPAERAAPAARPAPEPARAPSEEGTGFSVAKPKRLPPLQRPEPKANVAPGLAIHKPKATRPDELAPSSVNVNAPAPTPAAVAPKAPTADWERLVKEVMAQESILAETKRALSKKRSLLSLLGNVRDRELLYERGYRIGRAMHATDYSDLATRLAKEKVASEARFRKAEGDTLEVRLVGTAMAREAPLVGTCVCFIEAGLLAGALENLDGGRFRAREVRCVVKGDPACEFRAEREADAEDAPTLYDVVGRREGRL